MYVFICKENFSQLRKCGLPKLKVCRVSVQILETGCGYTLSGKLLNPYCTSARRYGLKPPVVERELTERRHDATALFATLICACCWPSVYAVGSMLLGQKAVARHMTAYKDHHTGRFVIGAHVATSCCASDRLLHSLS